MSGIVLRHFAHESSCRGRNAMSAMIPNSRWLVTVSILLIFICGTNRTEAQENSTPPGKLRRCVFVAPGTGASQAPDFQRHTCNNRRVLVENFG